MSPDFCEGMSMSENSTTVSVVIPCFSEAESLEPLHRRVSEACRAAADRYEIIFVDDGSKDDTWTRITALCSQDPHVRGLSLSRNFGHQPALTAGLDFAEGEWIFILDADLQDPPELLAAMLSKASEGYDVVYGRRIERAGETVLKRFTAAVFYRVLNKFVDISIPLDTGDFRLISRRAVDALKKMPETHRFVRGMVSWIGFKQCEIPYVREKRAAGITKYPFRKMLNFSFDAITGFCPKALRFAIYLAFCFGFACILVMGYALHGWLTGDVVPGWTSLMVVILMLGSIQLLTVGFMGEYMGRIFEEVKRRPLYIVKEVCAHPDR